MSFSEVCTYLGISRATLYRRIASKRIVPVKNPALQRQQLRFARADVERLKAG